MCIYAASFTCYLAQACDGMCVCTAVFLRSEFHRPKSIQVFQLNSYLFSLPVGP